MLCILIDFLQCDVVSRLNNNDAGVPDPIRVVWFFFVLFFLSDRPSPNQEMHSKLNEKKVQLMRFHLFHTAQFCPQIRKLNYILNE